MASDRMTLRELFLADSYQREIDAKDTRIAELQAQNRQLRDTIEELTRRGQSVNVERPQTSHNFADE